MVQTPQTWDNALISSTIAPPFFVTENSPDPRPHYVGPSNFHVKPSHERSHSHEGGHGHLHGLRSSENGVKLRTFWLEMFDLSQPGINAASIFKGLKSHETFCNWDKVGYIVGCMDITLKFHIDFRYCTLYPKLAKNFSCFWGATFQSLHVSVSDLNF